MANLDHLRGKFANARVQAHFGTCQRKGDSGNDALTTQVTLKQYRSVVLGAVPFLRGCGLLQVSGFWLSKRPAEKAVLADLLAWLADPDSALTCSICVAGTGRVSIGSLPIGGALERSMRGLFERTDQEVAALETEAEAVLQWLKRLTEGRCKAIDPNDEDADEA